MATQEALLTQLEEHVREEIVGQARLCELLGEHERAVIEGRARSIRECGDRLSAELRRVAARAHKRDRILAGLGKAWGVDPATLTLGSIVARRGAGTDGPGGERLGRMRAELRAGASRVARGSRRLLLACRAHQRILDEVIHAIQSDGAGAGGDTQTTSGGLVHLEA